MLERSTLDNGLFPYRHWSPESEQYARGDALYSFLMIGWQPTSNVVFYREIWLSGARQICILLIQLKKNEQIIEMPVLKNPFIHKMLCEMDIQQLPVEEKQRALSITMDR